MILRYNKEVYKNQSDIITMSIIHTHKINYEACEEVKKINLKKWLKKRKKYRNDSDAGISREGI